MEHLYGPGLVLHPPTKAQLFSVHPPSSDPRPYKMHESDVRLANPVAHSGLLASPRLPVTQPGHFHSSPSPESGDLDCAHTQAHEILRNHFGFLPYDPSLDLETATYKEPRSPSLSSPSGSRETSFLHHHRRSRTSPPSPTLDNSPLSNTMAKKRRSLTSILIPSFLPQASASTSALPIASPTGARSSISGTSASATNLTDVHSSTDWLSFYSARLCVPHALHHRYAPSSISLARMHRCRPRPRSRHCLKVR
ncbi:hypothetical protein LXA43DRAFT_95015 [Ganoderma leucocontextum]|nr:hypothetical protein LXA43DRAFT_95015 [Ganoderma leucocontextum]